MLSNQSKYAIRAVLYLAIYSNEKDKLSSKKVADVINVPAPFLAKIFQKLSKEKLILSSKGPNGGFFLTKNEKSKNLLDVIDCIDGLESFKTCFFGLPKCSDENPCSIHHIAAPLRDTLLGELTSRSIADFAEDTKTGKSFIFLK
jgi:Rrf2 family transcriptional regulator, iron-sulfur cluster assembly transcription factor